jgi:uncharacterized membrane protein
MYIKSAIEDNAILTLLTYIKAMRIRVTRKSVEDALLTHPDYPSMLSLSDALNKWNVDNGVVKISPVDLLKLNSPFITYLRQDGGIFAFVKAVKNDSVEWMHSQKGWQKETFGDFITKWNGTALIAELSAESGETGYPEKRRIEILGYLGRIGTSVAAVITLFMLCYIQLWKTRSDVHLHGVIGLLAVNLLGFFACVVLALIQLHPEHQLVRKFCSADGNAGCNKVLESNGSKLAGVLSWSDVGLFYFTSLITLTFFAMADQDILSAVVLINFFSLPFTLFSIYYQAVVLKAWCRLCLSVQVVLWVSCALAFSSTGGAVNFSEQIHKSLPYAGISLLVGLIVTKLLTTYLYVISELRKSVRDNRRVKYNKGVFDYLLSLENRMPEIPLDLDRVVIGDRTSDNVITVVTNPFCGPCSQLHGEVQELIRQDPALQINFIFTSTNEPDDLRGEFVRRLLAFPEDMRIQHLNEWFKLKEKNLSKWNIDTDSPSDKAAYDTVNLYRAWCQAANIVKTPTIYVNGRELPKVYGLNDIKLIVG